MFVWFGRTANKVALTILGTNGVVKVTPCSIALGSFHIRLFLKGKMLLGVGSYKGYVPFGREPLPKRPWVVHCQQGRGQGRLTTAC